MSRGCPEMMIARRSFLNPAVLARRFHSSIPPHLPAAVSRPPLLPNPRHRNSQPEPVYK